MDKVPRVVQWHPESASIENKERPIRLRRRVSRVKFEDGFLSDERNLNALSVVSTKEWNKLAVPETNVVHTAAGVLHAAQTYLE
jgi:hypothetical protein